jgi:thioester reductase-like protein
VLLTGATGFIGSHLLADLLRRTSAHVHCLVRAADRREAEKRLAAVLTELDLWDVEDRVSALPGNLGRPGLGLDGRDFTRLAREADAVVELLRLAATGRPKHLHHVSSLSALPAGRVRHPAHEGRLPGRPPADGYGQSKWVAERLLAAARGRHLPATVYRLSDVAAHSVTGRSNATALLDRLLGLCLRTGMRVPSAVELDWTPVDSVSAFLAAAVAGNGTAVEGPFLNVVRPARVRLDALLAGLSREHHLKPVEFPEFLAAVRRHAGHDPEAGRFLAVLPEVRGSRPADPLGRVFTDALAQGTPARAARAADRLGVPWGPSADAELRPYLARLAATHTRRLASG